MLKTLSAQMLEVIKKDFQALEMLTEIKTSASHCHFEVKREKSLRT
jgi:hypothetical protein